MSAIKRYLFGIFKYDPREIAPLNGLRTLAYFLVIGTHMYRPFEPYIKEPNDIARNIFNSGSLCMDIFFILSGFLISGPLFRELDRTNNIRLGVFFSKRTIRIFPPYFIFLSIQTFLFIPILMRLQPESRDALVEFQSKAIFDFLYISNYFYGTIPHGWSLSLEEQFYLLFPAFLLLVFKRIPERFRIASLSLWIVLPTIYRFFIYKYMIEGVTDPILAKQLYSGWIYYPLQGRLDSLFAGIILAYTLNRYPERIYDFLADRRKRAIALGIAIASIAYISVFIFEFQTSPMSMVFRFNINTLAWVIIIILSLRPESFVAKIFSLRIFAPIAKLSYCSYLIHFFLVGILTPAVINIKDPRYMDFAIWFIPTGIVIMCFGYLFHLVAERPFMVWKESKYGKEVILAKTENSSLAVKRTD
ncbi:acyltransferase [Leptospira fainei serovar Hurstbridge str. BUT 6]|uniref:Acyltransferase n=1 Tax=Leptospira fainei serovar Hurstbridge str. BUT 6 TaxID=1193011 RepID=S3V2S3_9LEPT|nr:acyltransferase [Leptospira fainei]EPG75738.1 acyltransferase [Leptospira fainei serovar Hurstbridge str. BUT 6]